MIITGHDFSADPMLQLPYALLYVFCPEDNSIGYTPADHKQESCSSDCNLKLYTLYIMIPGVLLSSL